MMAPIDVDLDALADVVRGITFPTSAKRRKSDDGLIACLRTTNVQDTVEWDDLLFVREEHVRSDAQLVRPGDILVSMSNSLDLVGKCAIVTTVPVRATFGAFVAVVRARAGIDPRYIFHVMRSPRYRAHIRAVASTTTNISNINSSKLLATSVPLFGDGTRGAIVSRIDELFSGIDEGVRALGRVQKLVERYRQSVLKAAVTGELTREWREKRRGKVESGEALLARILKARREAWERAERDKMIANGITPANDNWKQRYEEPPPADATGLPQLPEGWAWASLGQLVWSSQNGISKRSGESGRQVKVLRLADIADGRIKSDAPRSILLTEHEVERYGLHVSDLLCVRVNGSRSLTGRFVPMEVQDEWAYCDHFIRFRPVPDLVPYPYLDLCFDTGVSRQTVESKMVTTAGQNTVSQASLLQVPVPLPPLEEQKTLLSEAGLRFSQSLQQAHDVSVMLRAITALKRTVLHSAFSGRLVYQDPDDEPAAILLERIAAKHGAESVTDKRGRKKRVAA